jgi:hypothetical protein
MLDVFWIVILVKIERGQNHRVRAHEEPPEDSWRTSGQNGNPVAGFVIGIPISGWRHRV